jgi:plasmid stability protein
VPASEFSFRSWVTAAASIDSKVRGDVVAAVSIRGLDDEVKQRLRVRAARHGRSMEAEIRAILVAAVSEPEPSEDLFTSLVDRFGALGGVELDLPPRSTSVRSADFSS